MTISRSCGTFKGVLLLEVVVEILKCDHAVENQPDFRVMLFSTIYEVFSPWIKSMRMITKNRSHPSSAFFLVVLFIVCNTRWFHPLTLSMKP